MISNNNSQHKAAVTWRLASIRNGNGTSSRQLLTMLWNSLKGPRHLTEISLSDEYSIRRTEVAMEHQETPSTVKQTIKSA